MSSSAVHQSPIVSMLRELLAAEKVDTRRWLRAEMDRLVEPMLDSIFNRLETKLIIGMERDLLGDAGDHAQAVNPTFFDQSANVPLSATFICQPSTSTFFISPFRPVSISNAQFVSNELANFESRIIKQVFESTEPMTEGQFPQSLFAPIVNEQSNYSFGNWDEEECDCDDCVYGIEVTVKDDDSDSVKWIDDGQELSRPAKKPKMDLTQPNNAQPKVAGQSPDGQTTVEAHAVSNQGKQFITIHLQCSESNCSETFTEDKLNHHLWEKHFIGPYRCLAKECAQSFDNHIDLRQHIKSVHSDITEWHCAKCPKHCDSSQSLSKHNFQTHQLGHFQCSFLACTFTGECRSKVQNHYYKQHKSTLNCKYPDCDFRTRLANDLKRHIRTHSGIKPYRCKWSECDYAAAQQSNTIAHIRAIHFARNPSSVPNGVQLDPEDYVEVVHELL